MVVLVVFLVIWLIVLGRFNDVWMYSLDIPLTSSAYSFTTISESEDVIISESSTVDVCNITSCFSCVGCEIGYIEYHIYFTIKVFLRASPTPAASVDTDIIEQKYKTKYGLGEDDKVEITTEQNGLEIIAAVATNSTNRAKLYQIGNDVLNSPLVFANE